MDDPRIREALRALGPNEIDAVERFVERLREEGWLDPSAADRWKVALARAPGRRPWVRSLQG